MPRIAWGKHPLADHEFLHAIDLDKDDGNPFCLCGKILLNRKDPLMFLAELGESRDGKCPKCFKISRQMMQEAKRRNK